MDTTQTIERENSQLVPFSFENHAVRVIVIENDPWFVAKDVCDTLGLINHRKAVGDLPENEKGVTTGYTPGGKQKMLTVNEPGLYRLVFQSRKPDAEKFKTWVFTQVLPSIRRAGMFLPEGLNAMIRATVADAVSAMEREAVTKRGTLLSDEEKRFIAGNAGYPVWRLAALTGRGETTIRAILRASGPEQPSLFEEAAP
jgi:prophage antirepressor-like protein